MIRELYQKSIHLRNCIYLHLVKRNFQFSGNLTQIRGATWFYGRGKLKINAGVKINSGYRLNPIGRHTRTVFSCSDGACIEIGEYTGISNSIFFSRTGIKIGRHCKIGGGVEIYDTDFHWLNAEDRRLEKAHQANGLAEQVIIGNDVFLGSNVTVLRGSIIPDGTIIGSGSVICRQDIKPYEIWAGNPARKIGCSK